MIGVHSMAIYCMLYICVNVCRCVACLSTKCFPSYKPQEPIESIEIHWFDFLGSFMGAIERTQFGCRIMITRFWIIMKIIIIETWFWINNHEAALFFFIAVNGIAECGYFPGMHYINWSMLIYVILVLQISMENHWVNKIRQQCISYRP